jgi:peptidyl-tRNA hydrolase
MSKEDITSIILENLLKKVRGKMIEKINHAANMWNKTKDEKYKILWYQLIKEWANDTAKE